MLSAAAATVLLTALFYSGCRSWIRVCLRGSIHVCKRSERLLPPRARFVGRVGAPLAPRRLLRCHRPLCRRSAAGGERARWGNRSRELAEQLACLTGDVTVCSGICTYLGAFDRSFRAEATHDDGSCYYEGKESFATDGRRLAVPQPSAATYGSLISFKGPGQTLQVHAFLGTDPVITVGSNDLRWKTVQVVFAGGTVESAAAEHGLTAELKQGTTVSIGGLSGSGATYPSGLAMTVTFSSDTNMDHVMINLMSDTTAMSRC